MTFLKKAERLGADLVTLTGDYQQLKQQRDDLLARIHRDGGHHAEENGIDKAIDDAHIKVAELYLQRDELLERVATLESQLAKYKKRGA